MRQVASIVCTCRVPRRRSRPQCPAIAAACVESRGPPRPWLLERCRPRASVHDEDFSVQSRPLMVDHIASRADRCAGLFSVDYDRDRFVLGFQTGRTRAPSISGHFPAHGPDWQGRSRAGSRRRASGARPPPRSVACASATPAIAHVTDWAFSGKRMAAIGGDAFTRRQSSSAAARPA